MSRRNRLLAWAAALVALLPGCNLTSSGVRPDPCACDGAEFDASAHVPGKVQRTDYRDRPGPPPEPPRLMPSFTKGAQPATPVALARPAAQPDEPIGKARPL